jgi:hypothetical protein
VNEWELEFEAEAPESISSLMREVVDERMSARMSANQRAAAAWYRANGDRERNHTTGVFLKKARVAGAAPVLGVYVDSHAMVTDFGVNKDIYLARLANIGFKVSGIEFIPSRAGYHAARSRHEEPKKLPVELPELSPQELKEVQILVSDLPEPLKTNAFKAVVLSKRREKLETSQNGK